MSKITSSPLPPAPTPAAPTPDMGLPVVTEPIVRPLNSMMPTMNGLDSPAGRAASQFPTASSGVSKPEARPVTVVDRRGRP